MPPPSQHGARDRAGEQAGHAALVGDREDLGFAQRKAAAPGSEQGRDADAVGARSAGQGALIGWPTRVRSPASRSMTGQLGGGPAPSRCSTSTAPVWFRSLVRKISCIACERARNRQSCMTCDSRVCISPALASRKLPTTPRP